MKFSFKQFETWGKVQKLLMAMGQMLEKRSGKSATVAKKSGKVGNGGKEVFKSQQRWRKICKSQQGKPGW